MAKRVLDFLGAVLGIILCAPLLLVIGIAIRIANGSPVLFRQERIGYKNRRFTLTKFRTMTVAPSAGPVDTAQDAARLTRLGTFLRKTSLDELPTLWNVLNGDMSLVGPRPLLVEYLPLYSERQARRHDVRPGVTGWAQVNGRNAVSWEEKFELDVWYVENQSLLLDARILGMTITRVLNSEGVTQPGCATAERFKGSELE